MPTKKLFACQTKKNKKNYEKNIAFVPEVCYNKGNIPIRKEEIRMKAVITVVGHDTKGIIAKVSAGCAEAGANIIEISQSVLEEYFAMIMVINIAELNLPFGEFVDKMRELGVANGLDIRTMHEDIFNSMHKI